MAPRPTTPTRTTRMTLSAPGIEAIGRDILTLLASCASVTQREMDQLTVTLTRSSDKLAAALKKAKK